jgi:hypothetical protein
MKIRLSCLLLAMLALLVGCSGDSNSPVGDTTTKNQVPGEVKGVLDANAPSDDAVMQEMSRAPVAPTSPTDFSLAGYDVYCVTMVWGSLWNASSAANADSIDWSGSLSLFGAGEIHTIARIDFEKGQDSILAASVPDTVKWASVTNGDYDGLSFLVYIDHNQVVATIPRITFATGPITLEYQAPELKKLLEYYPISNTAGVAVYARQIGFRPCPQGTIEGNWFGGEPDSGIFRGMWLNAFGVPEGSVQGIWRRDTSSFGFGTLEGTVTASNTAASVTNRVIAVLRGKWTYDDPRLCPTCGQGHGYFEGSFWFTDNASIDARPDGAFKGEFGSLSSPPMITMPFKGKWQVSCPNIMPDVPNTVP